MSKLQPFPVIPEHDSQTDSWGFHLLSKLTKVQSREEAKSDSVQQIASSTTPSIRNFGRRESLKRRNPSSEAISETRTIKRRNSRIAVETDGTCDYAPPTHQCGTRRQSCLEYPTINRVGSTRIRFTSNGTQQRRYESVQDEVFSSQFIDPFTNESASCSRRVSMSSSSSGYLRPNAFTGHRDTLVRLHPRQYVSQTIPPQVAHQIMRSLTFEEYKNARLTCRQWHDILPKPKLPAVFRMPAEIVQKIYEYLQPCDFDAARHTCRSWFLASLDRAVGRKMMERAGCVSAFQADLDHRREFLKSTTLQNIKQGLSENDHRIQESFYEEWMISKRLATECRISAAWHGSGLSEQGGHSTSRLTVTELVNFDKLGLNSECESQYVKRFTPSGCGKFVLVVVGTDIFVYSLSSQSSTMQPCVRLATGREVLSVSMDSSSGRYAVAALLAGNLGACWELDDIFTAMEQTNSRGEPISLGMQTDVYGPTAPGTAPLTSSSLSDQEEEYSLTLNGNELQAAVPSAGFLQRNVFGSDPTSLSWCASPSEQSSPSFSEVELPDYFDGLSVVPIRTKPTHVYKRLGYTNDEPLSVAICPQRQCVAFGCKTGIELHWVDGLTGRNLNRWFPLSAPSEHLYFLPQRIGVDSTTKLRLISSARGPTLRTAGRHNSAPHTLNSIPASHLHGRRQSMTRLFFGHIPFPSSIGTYDTGIFDEQETQGVLRTVDCDHYCAVPLSDGTHVLFTDPLTGHLCLGSDAPLGGPTKLVRKAIMIPPTSDKVEIGALSCYAASQDLSFGVRIVAAYDDGSIVLYNIPSDCFERIRKLRSSTDVWDELSGVMGQSDLLMDTLMADRFDLNGTQPAADTIEPGSPISLRALQISGAYVGRVGPDVEDLHLDCHDGGLKLWAFHHSGQAMKMDIHAPRNHQTKTFFVGVDGLIKNLQEAEQREECALEVTVDEDNSKSRVKFMGFDGTSELDFHNEDTDFEQKLALLEQLSTMSRTMHPDLAEGQELQVNGLRNNAKFELEVLTDWRNAMLLAPYLVRLA